MHDVFYIFLNLPPNFPIHTSWATLTKALTRQIFKRPLYEHILPRVLLSLNLYSYLLIPFRKMREILSSIIHLLWDETCSVKLRFLNSCSWHVSGVNRRIKLSTSTCSCEYNISILIISKKMQQYAGIYLLQNHSTCFGCPSHPSPRVHKSVTAVTGRGHSIWAATFLQRGQFGHVGGKLLLRYYDLYRKLQLQFYVFLMMGAMYTRNI